LKVGGGRHNGKPAGKRNLYQDGRREISIPFRAKSIHADLSACRTPLNCRTRIEIFFAYVIPVSRGGSLLYGAWIEIEKNDCKIKTKMQETGMSNLQVFVNEEFGQVRTVTISGEPWFVGKDVAVALGYSNHRDALYKHVDSEDKGESRIAAPVAPVWGRGLKYFRGRSLNDIQFFF